MTMEGLFVNDIVMVPLIDVKLIRKRINNKGEVMDITVYLGNGVEVILKHEEAIEFIDTYSAWWEDTK